MMHRAAAVFLGLASGLFAFAAAFAVLHSTLAAIVIALVATSLVAGKSLTPASLRTTSPQSQPAPRSRHDFRSR